MITNHMQDAFGQPTSSGASSDPYLGRGAQAGYYRDSETGLYLCTNRYYDPVNARFLNRDPIGYQGGMNLYGYCLNNPIGNLDPSGFISDLYDVSEGAAVRGIQRGGFLGDLQALGADTLTALADTFGGRTVKAMSSKSGSAAGCGDTAGAVGYGVLTAGYIALEAFTFGRGGAMVKAPLKGVKALGTEFSHFIGEATMRKFPLWRLIFSPQRTIFNGRVVSTTEHALTDAYRWRFLPRSVKEAVGPTWGAARSYLNRAPDWMRFLGFRAGTSTLKGMLGN